MIRKLAVVLFAMVVSACATAPQQSPAGGMMLSDAEIAAILTAHNEGEVRQSEIARTRATSPEVRAFAEMMVRDHTAALERMRDVLSRANVTPMDNQLSRTLRTNADQTARALEAMSGAEFDRTYMRTQVEAHDWGVRAIETSLRPSARSSQLVMFLRDARTTMAAHLERARQVQQGLR